MSARSAFRKWRDHVTRSSATLRSVATAALIEADSVVFCMFAHPLEHFGPAARHALAVIDLYTADRGMPQGEPRLARFAGGQAKLQVGHGGVAHEEWAGDFEQRRPLDHLNVAPEMPLLAAEVAVPASSRTQFQLHVHVGLLRRIETGPKLLEQGIENRLGVGGDFDV